MESALYAYTPPRGREAEMLATLERLGARRTDADHLVLAAASYWIDFHLQPGGVFLRVAFSNPPEARVKLREVMHVLLTNGGNIEDVYGKFGFRDAGKAWPDVERVFTQRQQLFRGDRRLRDAAISADKAFEWLDGKPS